MIMKSPNMIARELQDRMDKETALGSMLTKNIALWAANEAIQLYNKQFFTPENIQLFGLSTKGGLLFIHRQEVDVYRADQVAQMFGFMYAEHIVHALEKLNGK